MDRLTQAGLLDRGTDVKHQSRFLTGSGLTLLFWMSLRMCSKQLLLRKTACRTGLSEHCRISGTTATIDKEGKHIGNNRFSVAILVQNQIKEHFILNLLLCWTCAYLAFDSGVRSGSPPSSACSPVRWWAVGSSWATESSYRGSSWSRPAALRGYSSAEGGSSPSSTAKSSGGVWGSSVQGRHGNTMPAKQRTNPQQTEGW